MGDSIDIAGIDKAELLAALHAGTASIGMGVMHDRGPLSVDRARKLLAGQVTNGTTGTDGNTEQKHSFDYVEGRPMKITMRGDELLGAWLYDRDAPGGEGSCARIVTGLRKA